MDLLAQPDLSERQKREKEYYESYAQNFDVNKEIDFAPIRNQVSG